MNKPPTYAWRYAFVIFILFLGVCGLVWRMVDLTVLDRAFLQGQSDARTIRVVNTPAYRGMITDRNGEPLAISTPVDSVWINPKQYDPANPNVARLADYLNLSIKYVNSRAIKMASKDFTYLKRGISPSLAKDVKALKIPGVYLQREFRRYYPEGEVTSHLLGFTNIDDRGQEGIELTYNKWLEGNAGKKRVLKDRLGHVIEEIATISEPQAGKDIALSIDRRIQYLAYRELKQAVEHFKAKSGTIVVLDVKTGEVLAMVNTPSFNPNIPKTTRDGSYRNRAVTDVFEPGSVMKAFSVASGLDSGKYTPATVINTEPGWMVVDGNTIKDIHNYGSLTVAEILKRSSNVGVSKMTLSQPADQLLGLLERVGFGERTGTGFPGESPGVLVDHPVWRPFVLATLAFGYGVSVTPLQLTQAYAVLASGGIKRPVSLLSLEQAPKGKQVINSKVANDIVTMLESVVTRYGTGSRAMVSGYRVAGKTGTSRMAGPNGYEKNHHIAIFTGMAPLSDPRLVATVIITDPQNGEYYGGIVAGPVFAKVMGGSLRTLDIVPDDLS